MHTIRAQLSEKGEKYGLPLKFSLYKIPKDMLKISRAVVYAGVDFDICVAVKCAGAVLSKCALVCRAVCYDVHVKGINVTFVLV